MEATDHCGLSLSSTVESTSSSRLVFSCGVDCLFSLWLKYTVLRKFSLLLLLMIEGETFQVFSLAAKQQLKIAG